MKKFKIISYIILFIVLVILALIVYTSATQNNEEDGKEKAISEIKYLDSKLVELFNHMNNIETRNYKIYTTKTEESSSKQSSGEGASSSGGNGNSSGSSGSGADSSSNSDSTSNSSATTQGADSGTQKQNQWENYEMKASGILTSDRNTIDWNLCKNELELIYTSISTITLDLYSLNVAQEDILNFNKEIDNLTASFQEENKQLSLENLVKVYEYISKFTQNVVDDTLYKTVVETKLNVFKAYSILDNKDWETIKKNLTDAINIYSSLLTNTGVDASKQASVNKGYVLLNELKNTADIENDSVFLIKYKNLLEEINNM